MYSSYSYGSSSDSMAMLAGMGTVSIIISIAAAVFGIICLWKIFNKAGEGGWKTLIPILNAYTFYKIAWEVKYFIFAILGIVAAFLLMYLGARNGSGGLAGFSLVLAIILYILIGVLSIIAMIKMAKRFGKSGGFGVGLIFLAPIFLAILAFDSSDYDRNRA